MKWPKSILLKHSLLELLFDEHHFPVVFVATQVGQGVVAVDKDEVELGVVGAEVAFAEELAQGIVVDGLTVAPDDQGFQSFAVRLALHNADVIVLISVFGFHIEADEVIEGFHHIDMGVYQLVVLGGLQRHGEGIPKPLQIEQRIAGFSVEHVAEHIAFVELLGQCFGLLLLDFKVVQGILILLQTNVFEALGNAFAGNRFV